MTFRSWLFTPAGAVFYLVTAYAAAVLIWWGFKWLT
jgi:hypothetical protein